MNLTQLKDKWNASIVNQRLMMHPVAQIISASLNENLIDLRHKKSLYNDFIAKGIGNDPYKDSELIVTEMVPAQKTLSQIHRKQFPETAYRVTLNDSSETLEAIVKAGQGVILMGIYRYNNYAFDIMMVIEIVTVTFNKSNDDMVMCPASIHAFMRNELNSQAIVLSAILQSFDETVAPKEKVNQKTGLSLTQVLQNFLDLMGKDPDTFVKKYETDEKFKSDIIKLVNRPCLLWPDNSNMKRFANRINDLGIYSKAKRELQQTKPFILHRTSKKDILYYTGETLKPELKESHNYYLSYRFQTKDEAKKVNAENGGIYTIGNTHKQN